jgi:hypothetical protein
MAMTKANATLLNAVTATTTSSAQDVSTDYADDLYVSIAIAGATATVAPSFQIQWSEDGGTKYFNSAVYTAGLTAATYDFPPVSIPVTATHVKVVFTLGTVGGGGTHTCTAQLGRVTAI